MTPKETRSDLEHYEEEFGSCPDCDEGIESIEAHLVREHAVARDWDGWPVPPPSDWPRKLVAGEYEIQIECPQGHIRTIERTVIFK